MRTADRTDVALQFGTNFHEETKSRLYEANVLNYHSPRNPKAGVRIPWYGTRIFSSSYEASSEVCELPRGRLGGGVVNSLV